jgi:hypothetical protein
VKQQQGCGAGEIAMVPKTVKEAEEMDFTGVSPELLPEVRKDCLKLLCPLYCPFALLPFCP